MYAFKLLFVQFVGYGFSRFLYCNEKNKQEKINDTGFFGRQTDESILKVLLFRPFLQPIKKALWIILETGML